MKKYLLLILVFGVSLMGGLLATPKVGAIEVFGPCSNAAAVQGSVCKDARNPENTKTNPVNRLLKIILNILAFVAGIAAIILIIVNSLRLIASGGDSNGVKSARSGLVYALVGVAIVVAAQSIIIFVLDKIS